MQKTEKELLAIKEAAKRKKELFENIYDITSRRKFLGAQSEIDEFTEYLNIRQPYYEELETLNKVWGAILRDFEIDFSNKNKLYVEISQIILNAKDVSAQIIEMDKENNKNMKCVLDELMLEVKTINSSKKALDSYKFFQVQGDSSYMDSKN